MPRKQSRRYMVVPAEDIVKIVPEGYKLAVLKLPFTGKFRLTWWLDANGRLGRKGVE
ncbi:hypothetical protein [Arthrobacter sp. zg-Y1110]|uniref:hypothetical protein n=1 Tax=Arthrobacter sp. zg-Y1110 TaxID=2886932 RepID=UPI001D13AD78|nr:hypothetical protein [Arthrobacter sp. zg-Y1110]MCC3292411.1 hypothetical protein [Arthrobacter sp. zg-Y1110]UWX87153.1 hypothetical protein N2K99_17750 [Arthrobacter sp. zg-Y1110]